MKQVLGLLAFVAALFSVAPAQAANYTVDGSVYRIDMNLRLYEICGKVTGDAPVAGLSLDIIADVGRHQGNYVTQTNADGKFCQVIRLQGTRLEVKVIGANSTVANIKK